MAGGGDNLADPFNALSLIPASTGLYRDMTQIRFEHPVWIPEKCTACSDCFTVCPDSAIPGLVNSVQEVFDTALRRVEGKGRETKYLRRHLRTVEKKLRDAVASTEGDSIDVGPLLSQVIVDTITDSDVDPAQRPVVQQEFDWFREAVGGFKFAITKPYYGILEKQNKGSGGLFSITINPYTCKGCMECVTICADGALRIDTQTPESIETLRNDWAFWLDLPSTASEYVRIDDLDQKSVPWRRCCLTRRTTSP